MVYCLNNQLRTERLFPVAVRIAQYQHPNDYKQYKSMAGMRIDVIRYIRNAYRIFKALHFFATDSLIFTAEKLFHQVI